MDAVGTAHWTEVLGAWAWFLVILELHFLFWFGVVEAIGGIL